MDDAALEHDKPRFLLPDGCKDLNDLIRLQEEAARHSKWEKKLAEKMPKLPEEIILSETVCVEELAGMLCLKPFVVIAGLLQLKVFASVETKIDFTTASVLCAVFGVNVRKAGAS